MIKSKINLYFENNNSLLKWRMNIMIEIYFDFVFLAIYFIESPFSALFRYKISLNYVYVLQRPTANSNSQLHTIVLNLQFRNKKCSLKPTFLSSFLLFYNILSDCHKSDEINYLLNAFRLKKCSPEFLINA